MTQMGLFTGTADYYDQYRPGVPQEVVDTILGAVATPITLLDLGCGTGRITEQFAPYFSETLGVEPEVEMRKIARKRLAELPATILPGTAEDVKLPAGWQASLVFMCRSFHWMPQHAVLSRLESIVAADGVIAVLSDSTFWTLSSDWAEMIKDLLAHYIGEERRTLFGTYKPPMEYFGKSFTSPVFTELERHMIPVERQWTADQLIGYLYSTSYASHAVLGDKAPIFEKQLRERLHQLSADDLFTEHNRFDILLARRPLAT
ncbi:MAG TPA: class I SAM-dependent methyltransferase [Candidatus Saccharimonadales bacterium]|nr:class I SAM-dependent methyltransferase [Candidatus Saccharimonadales bacterium]